MSQKEQIKAFHSRNFHNKKYDFEILIQSELSLGEFVKPNKYGDLSIDFSNSHAVMALNKALLSYFYNIKTWQIPKGYLCPPIPGRADYLHYIADVLSSCNNNIIPYNNIRALDIGIGANGIYALIGSRVYNWSFVGTDIDENSIQNVQNIINNNDNLNNIEIRKQPNSEDIFKNIITKNDRFDFTMCNPPFHKSKKEAKEGTNRKIRNLTKKDTKSTKLNFGGQSNELWCSGGELKFITNMIEQSCEYSKNCFWFTSLVSKKENLKSLYQVLKKVRSYDVKTIEMKQGHKNTRFIAWTFLNRKEQELWVENW